MDLFTFILSMVALLLSLYGNVLVNIKNKLGFPIWIISNVIWITVNLMSVPNYPQILMYIIYIGLNVQGFILWNTSKRKNTQQTTKVVEVAIPLQESE